MEQLAQHELEHSFTVLAVTSSDSWPDIERQYRKLIQLWHPDRNIGENQDEANNRFIEINTAYKKLKKYYYRNGGVPRQVPPVQDGSLLGTKKKVPVNKTIFSNKLVIAGVLSVAIVAVFSAILWSLDSKLAENNRDRATLEKEDTDIKTFPQPEFTRIFSGEKIEQSSAELEP